jgi:hypothetical protein
LPSTEVAQRLVRERGVEVGSDLDFPRTTTRLSLSNPQGHETGNGLSRFGDDDFLAGGGAINELR